MSPPLAASVAPNYKHFKDLKNELKDDLGDSPWLIGDRLRAFQQEGSDSQRSLARSLELEIAALARVYEYTRTVPWQAVTRQACANTADFCRRFRD